MVKAAGKGGNAPPGAAVFPFCSVNVKREVFSECCAAVGWGRRVGVSVFVEQAVDEGVGVEAG